MRVRVKVCGVTRLEDALGCAELGVDAIGLNFWDGSPRRCPEPVARRIVEALSDRVRLVAVVVDAPGEAIVHLRESVGVRWIQLHGDEPPSALDALGPEALKAVRVGSAADLESARGFGGQELLVDSRVPGRPGGTGIVCDWASAARLARERRVWLAGGIRPDNVQAAVGAVAPYGVDVASGVESAPGEKDLAAVEALLRALR